MIAQHNVIIIFFCSMNRDRIRNKKSVSIWGRLYLCWSAGLWYMTGFSDEPEGEQRIGEEQRVGLCVCVSVRVRVRVCVYVW